jgi:hypothetical protein
MASHCSGDRNKLKTFVHNFNGEIGEKVFLHQC